MPGAATRPAEFARTVAAWYEALAASEPLAAEGVTLEDKRYSLSLHYRRATNPAKAQSAIKDAVARLAPVPRVIPGKAVVNLLPFGAPDKGDAIRALIEETGCSNVLYVGDDDTDAFDIQFRIAQGAEVAHARLGNQRNELCVVEMVAVIDVADVDGDFGREGEGIGQVDLDAGHGSNAGVGKG